MSVARPSGPEPDPRRAGHAAASCYELDTVITGSRGVESRGRGDRDQPGPACRDSVT